MPDPECRESRLLILETSCREGLVALAEGDSILACRRLEEARRHARDLVPVLAALLNAQGWKPRDLHGVIVSRGPGSYTGLRVGVMSAKTLAYATGCALLAVETFAAIAFQAPAEVVCVEVWADAQQGRLYVQRFQRPAAGEPLTPTGGVTIEEYVSRVQAPDVDVWLTGPGVERYETGLPERCKCLAKELRTPRPLSLLELGRRRLLAGERDEVWSLEPLYLRASSAEEQWQRLGRT